MINSIDKTKRTIALLNKAAESIRLEIEKASRGEEAVDCTDNLINIANSINEMIANLEGGNIPPKEKRSIGLWRLVTDTWPYNAEISRIVVEAELSYDRL